MLLIDRQTVRAALQNFLTARDYPATFRWSPETEAKRDYIFFPENTIVLEEFGQMLRTYDPHASKAKLQMLNNLTSQILEGPDRQVTEKRSSGKVVFVDELESQLTALANHGSGVNKETAQALLVSIADRKKGFILPSRSRARAVFICLRSLGYEFCRWFAQLLYGF